MKSLHIESECAQACEESSISFSYIIKRFVQKEFFKYPMLQGALAQKKKRRTKGGPDTLGRAGWVGGTSWTSGTV